MAAAWVDKYEMLSRAYEASPDDRSIALKFGYYLEQRDLALEAAEVLGGYRNRKSDDDAGLRIAAASLCPPHSKNASRVKGRYAELLGRLESLRVEESGLEPSELVGSMPISWPYLGYSVAPLMSRLAALYRNATTTRGVAPRARRRARAVGPKIGVVAELGLNTSPGMLFEKVFLGLCGRFETYIIAPTTLDTPFLNIARRAAIAVDAVPSDLDVLVYLALGLSSATWTLAMSRLAPVQIVFGHGHPITSGLDTVDYFVSSVEFQRARYAGDDRDEDEPRNPDEYDAAAARAAGIDVVAPVEAVGPRCRDGLQAYAEQLVLFDSRTIGIEPPAVVSRVEPPRTDSPVFACLQHSKKFHPDFDLVLRAVLEAVPDAKILVLEGTRRAHLERWTLSLGEAVDRLVFVPRTTRSEILTLVASADAFLDTFPWGAGLTLLESLAVCTPPVILPANTTVLQLGLGHLRAAGLEEDLVARDIPHFASIARRLATDATFRIAMRRRACASRAAIFDEKPAIEEWAAFIARVVRG
ncbi:hypothetical protein CTAYLR_003176 [Chrysophaeum taylorii]|uniref:O-GlcNAc transferase C-terminal domain-containing protein n=1 Tax=Chrysophaeum taylorii TaxID=2483200 RepID=A0AAD7UD09_9STRA|nr:hypothetical protein CTAYLR_003176 [Chrysophaeum taylorii]